MLKYVIHNWERKLSRRDNNRVERPFDWGTEYLDPELCAEEPGAVRSHPRDIISQFNHCAITNSSRFFSSDLNPEYDFDDGFVRFASTLTTPFVENNAVFARYFPVAAATNGSAKNEVRSEERRVGKECR